MLLFELRSFLDSLDGLVARSRANQRAIVADSSQWGYWVDGLCDLFGTIFFMIAVLLICQKALPRKLITFNVRSLFYHWIPDKIKKNTLAMTEADQKVCILNVLFCQIKSFIRFRLAFVFGLQTF